MDETLVKAMVDEYTKWVSLADEAKKQIEKYKADFSKLAMETLKDTKTKQVEYWGSKNSKVVVTTTESLKLVSYNFLRQTIGDLLLQDFVKTEPKYKLSEPFKKIMTAIFQGSYIEQPVDAVLAQISSEDKVRKALKKKLRGNNWEKDVKYLKDIAGLSQGNAEHFAYFIQEAIAYERIVHLLEAAGHKRGSESFNAAIEAIRHAVVVEEGVSVGLESEDVA